MKMIRNLNIGKRLALVVIAAVLVTVAAVAINMQNSKRLTDEIDFGYEAITRPLAAVANARGQFNAIRTGLYNLAHDFNSAEQNKEFKREIMENLSDYESNIKSYKEMIDKYGTNDPYESEAVEYLYNQLEPLRANVEYIVAVAEKVGHATNAVRILRGNFLNAANEVSDDLEALTIILEEQTVAAAIYAKEVERFNALVLILIMGFNIVFMIFVSYTTVRSITVPIYETSKVLNEIAKGNFDARVKGDYKSDMALMKNTVNDTALKLSSYLHDKLEAERAKFDLLDKVFFDALTGIYNRRYLGENLKRIIKSAARNNKKIGVLMLDVDFFKRYNDTYGHDMGDDCLKCIAKTLKESLLRPDDFVARYGGEEFVAVLPDTDETGLYVTAERMLQNVRACKIPHERNEPVGIVTISIGGVVCEAVFSDNMSDYIKCADQALYSSKKNARNRYTFHECKS